MPKGRKRTKGVPELHDEIKARVTLALTPTAVKGLDSLAEKFRVSRSELVEQIGRRKIPLASHTDLGNVDPKVYDFIAKAIRDLPPTDSSSSSVKVISFKERHKVPGSPGAYILSNWRLPLPGTTTNLREEFLSEEFIAVNKRFIENLEENSFIIWQSFQDIRVLEDTKLALKEVGDVYSNLKKEVIARALQKTMEQINSKVADQETQDSDFLAS